MQFKNTRELVTAVKASGSHFFDEDTMRFFGSRVESGVYGEDGTTFITSEQDSMGYVYDGQRRYFPRVVSQGRTMLMIDRIGPDDGFPTPAAAKDWIKSQTTNVRHLVTKFGNPAKDQKVTISPEGVETFISYGTVIARRHNGVLTLDTHADDYSQTTSTYLNQFTGMTKPERRKAASIIREDMNA